MSGAPTAPPLPVASTPELVAIIRDTIADAGGAIPFARFMDLALDEPTWGYYRVRDERPGRGGDFVTAPELSPLFGRCLFRQLRELWTALGEPGAFTVLEYGAGGGRLAYDILVAARAADPAFFAALRYRLHEGNVHRRASARALLTGAGFADRIACEGPDAPPDDAAPFVGAIVSNEFADALPTHRVRGAAGDAIEEAFVGWDAAAGGFVERWAAPSTPRLAAALAAGGVRGLGARAEEEAFALELGDQGPAASGRGAPGVQHAGHAAVHLRRQRAHRRAPRAAALPPSFAPCLALPPPSKQTGSLPLVMPLLSVDAGRAAPGSPLRAGAPQTPRR